MNKKLYLPLLLAGFLLLTACNTSHRVPCTSKPLVGSDRDAHGCIASAGYQWSELLKDCIRPFEKGIRMSPVSDPSSSLGAYLVFSADQSKVEVYLPQEKHRPLLSRKGDVWKSRHTPNYQVKRTNGKWGIYNQGKLIYSE